MSKPFTNLIRACCALLFLLLVSAPNANAQRCASASTFTIFKWLSNVQSAGINNACNSSAYSDFTAFSGTVNRGLSFDFTRTISQTASDPDAESVNPVNLISYFQSQTVTIVNDVPFGISVTSSIEGSGYDYINMIEFSNFNISYNQKLNTQTINQ